VSSRSGAVLVAQTAIRFLALSLTEQILFALQAKAKSHGNKSLAHDRRSYRRDGRGDRTDTGATGNSLSISVTIGVLVVLLLIAAIIGVTVLVRRRRQRARTRMNTATASKDNSTALPEQQNALILEVNYFYSVNLLSPVLHLAYWAHSMGP